MPHFRLPQGIPKAAKMRSNSILELPKLIFGQIAYFVAPDNENQSFTLPKIIKNYQKSCQKSINTRAQKTEGFRSRLSTISNDFGRPQGGPKITKSQKNAFQKTMKKKGKKRRYLTSGGSMRAAHCQPRNQRSRLLPRLLPED